MSKNLVIVESPAKAKTIEKYLGKNFRVIASFGHIRDLPKAKLGIDVEHNFEPSYIIPTKSKKHLSALKKAIVGSSELFLATDLDREGEAIAWHIIQAVEPKRSQKVSRITFSEITQPAIKQAIQHPREINMNLVNAQQARRVLDRLVGYKLSPILWKKVRSGLSAGRVQSVALKFIIDREEEIDAFNPQEYWSIEATFNNAKDSQFKAQLSKINSAKAEIKNKKQSDDIVTELKNADFSVSNLTQRVIKKNPLPPFITSTLQRSAHTKLGYSAKKTMLIAQKLYETGYITYMRTDSTNLSTLALKQIKNQIIKEYGEKYALSSPRFFKKTKGAQEAHEAIRPSDPSKTPDILESKLPSDQSKLYQLIFVRTLASQMPQAIHKITTADIKSGNYLFRASGREVIFDGFNKLYSLEGKEDKLQILPELKEGEKLKLISILPNQHFTQPPPRYSEASLVKKLEGEGIGRPSTYAPTISTLIARGYVTSEEKKLVPQEIGKIVCELLKNNFAFVLDPKFTAEMETKLDSIAQGKIGWQPVVKQFYDPLENLVETKAESIKKVKIPVIETDEICEKCGRKMVIKTGRFGQFLACSGFPECKSTKPIIKSLNMICPKCHKGEVIEKKTRKGRVFYGCSRYPDCKFASWSKPKIEKKAKNI